MNISVTDNLDPEFEPVEDAEIDYSTLEEIDLFLMMSSDSKAMEEFMKRHPKLEDLEKANNEES